MTHDTASLLALAEDIATEAAELILRRRREGVAVAATKTSSVDIVTAADRECEALVRARLQQARPDDGFYGEEGTDVESASGITWVVDPIDGTVNYLYGLPGYAVSIAAVTGDAEGEFEPLVGVVAAPAMGETYTARAGEGAWLGGDRLELGAGPEDLAHTLIATGFSYRPQRRILQGRVLAALIGEVRDVRRMGAASLDLCAVATGRIDAYYEFGLHPWDWAAGALVATEAGAIVSGLRSGESASRSSLLAAHPAIAGTLVDVFRGTDAEKLM